MPILDTKYKITDTESRLKIIAHGVKNLKEAKKAIRAGVDFLEIDVAKRVFFNKFTAQHNGLLGIAGIGTMLEKILITEVKTRAFLDLKPVSFRNTFTHRLSLLLTKVGVKNAKICGHNWQLISNLCAETDASPFYTIKNKNSVQKFKRMMSVLKKPNGFSVRHDLIDKNFMKEFENKSVEIWAWTVNEVEEAKRLARLGVDGIITDEWKMLSTLKS